MHHLHLTTLTGASVIREIRIYTYVCVYTSIVVQQGKRKRVGKTGASIAGVE